MKRRQSGRLMLALLGAVALVAAGSSAWLGSQRATASSGAAASQAGWRERDPANRHDELHRLVQPVELHRGPGAERDGHDLPAPRPARLHEQGGLRHRRRLGEVVEGVQRRQDVDVQAAPEREVVRRQGDDGRRRRVDDQHDDQVRRRCDCSPGSIAQPREARAGAELDDARPELLRTGVERALPAGGRPDGAAARLGAAREEGEGRRGAQDVPAAGQAADGHGRRLHREEVREEGHDRSSSRIRTSTGRSRTPTRSC